MKNLTNEVLTKAAKDVEERTNELNKNDKYNYKSSVNASIKNPDSIRYIDVVLKEERIVGEFIRSDTIIITFNEEGDALSVDGSFSFLHLQWFIEAVAKEMKE